MTDYENLQARCQRGEPSLGAANNLLAECRAAIGRLIAENERVEIDNEDLRTKAQDALVGQLHLTNERDLLKTELAGLRTGFDAQNEVIAGLRKDVERYQWVKQHCDIDYRGHRPDGDYASTDESIDAAMGKGGNDGT